MTSIEIELLAAPDGDLVREIIDLVPDRGGHASTKAFLHAPRSPSEADLAHPRGLLPVWAPEYQR
jgi:hypothetical protein